MNSIYLHKIHRIPLNKRITWSSVRDHKSPRFKDFDIMVQSVNFDLTLHYGEQDDKAYLYHERGSLDGERGVYHEIVWMEGDDIIFWDDTLQIPVASWTISSIDTHKDYKKTFFMDVEGASEGVIGDVDSRYISIMKQLHPLWSPEESWWEFCTNMTGSMAMFVQQALVNFGATDDPISIRPHFRSAGRHHFHTVDYYPAFTYQYASYPKEHHALGELVKFIQKLWDNVPTHGGWGDSCHIVVKKNYNIELQLSATEIMVDNEYGEQTYDTLIVVPLGYIHPGKYHMDGQEVEFKWDDENVYDDQDIFEDGLWQVIDGSIGHLMTEKEEE